MTLKERIVSAWKKIDSKVTEALDYLCQKAAYYSGYVVGWVSKQAKAAEALGANLVSTEPGFEISKRVISSMPQAAITVIAIQMAMAGAGIGVVGITLLVSVFCVSAIWATKARNEAIVTKD